MWYMVVGLGLWILCGCIGVRWLRKDMKKEYGVSDEDFYKKIPPVYILTGPCTKCRPTRLSSRIRWESDMQGDILTKTKDTYEKVMRIVRFLNRKWVYIAALLILSAMLFAAIFNINSMAMAPTEQGYNLHILATKLKYSLLSLAFSRERRAMWKRDR